MMILAANSEPAAPYANLQANEEQEVSTMLAEAANAADFTHDSFYHAGWPSHHGMALDEL